MSSHFMSGDFATTGIFISGNKGFKAGITITLLAQSSNISPPPPLTK